MSGTASTADYVMLSGNYNRASAALGQMAAVGVGGVNVMGNTGQNTLNGGADNFNWPTTPLDGTDNPYTGLIETASGNFVEAQIGSTMTSGFEQLQAVGAFPTMFGSSGSYAGFSGAYASGGMPQIETHVAGTTDFGMLNAFPSKSSWIWLSV